jgi:exodeoxyribonuclease VII large subunit
LPLPLVPQRIAVISSDTAAGYGDFLNQLTNNNNGYKFHTELFPAIMQGEKSAESIINAFNEIFERIDNFDVVVLIRGGGSKSDLSCFDDYELAYYITQFPLPVLTGIGHERDDTIADITAHTKLKTPTAVAEFLITQTEIFNNRLDEAQSYLTDLLSDFFNENEYLLEELSNRLKNGTEQLLLNKEHFLAFAKADVINKTEQLLKNKETQLSVYNKDIIRVAKGVVDNELVMCDLRAIRLKKWLGDFFRKKEQQLQFLEQKIDLVNPQNILERGFAWVTHNNEIVTDSSKLKKNDEVKIQLAKGNVKAKIK